MTCPACRIFATRGTSSCPACRNLCDKLVLGELVAIMRQVGIDEFLGFFEVFCITWSPLKVGILVNGLFSHVRACPLRKLVLSLCDKLVQLVANLRQALTGKNRVCGRRTD